MSKGTKKKRDANGSPGYKASLRDLQIELVKTQKHIIDMICDLIAQLVRPGLFRNMWRSSVWASGKPKRFPAVGGVLMCD